MLYCCNERSQGLFLPDNSVTGVKGLVFIGDRILTYRRDENAPDYQFHLDLPGGASEPHETPFQTFQREVKEEFDLDLEPGHIVDAEKRQRKADPSKAVYFPIAHIPDTYAKNITLGNEGTDFLLLSVQEFLSRADIIPYFQKRVAEYLETKGQGPK